ncbi:MAG TPA: hypothetical protein VHE34_29020 [Puia sp.]|uniref:hypothetical protein n=1 Tax=Puia sp. TaxID=2045100 RepID=UPI002C574255|nr:hypothetical protein [Puia sp.]HVU99312.1 hypothetical protein [Puia sp.]
MALIFLDKSECALCGKVLKEHDEIVALPAASDTANPLYKYFDQGFHKSCFELWDKKEEVQAILQKQKEDFEKSDYYKEMSSRYGKPKNI